MRSIRILAVLAALPLMHGATYAQPVPDSSPRVTGSAWVDAIVLPSRAMILLALSGEGESADAAAARVAELDAVVRRAVGNDVTITPWGYGLGENQQIRRMLSQSQQVTTSRDFLARSGIAVITEDPARVPAIARAVTQAGATAITGVLYLAADDDPALQEAIQQAARIARRNAETLASAEGAQVGQVLTLSASPQYMGNSFVRYTVPDQTGVPLQPNEILIRVTVHATWELVRR